MEVDLTMSFHLIDFKLRVGIVLAILMICLRVEVVIYVFYNPHVGHMRSTNLKIKSSISVNSHGFLLVFLEILMKNKGYLHLSVIGGGGGGGGGKVR